MKTTFLLTLCIFIAWGCDTAPKTKTQKLLSYQDEITPDFLHSRLAVIADDSMEGRETAMPGQKKAAHYLADQYRKMGLKPVGDDSTYLQKFDLTATQSDSIVFITYKGAGGAKKQIDRSVSSAHSSANYIRSFGGNKTLDGDIVFAGFGVDDPAHQVHNLRGADIKGKWVMVFENIPHVVDGDTLIGSAVSARGRLGSILQQGAAGILVIPEMSEQEFEDAATSRQQTFDKPSGMQLAYLGGDQRSRFSGGYNMISPAEAATILDVSGKSEGLKKLRQKTIQNIKQFSARNTGYGLRQIPHTRKVTLQTENVVALLEGSDPELKDQVVVLSAHYDHLGIGRPDSTGDRINNGADDDGSGTVGLLNMAHAYVSARENGVQPKRSILFLHVTGEEKGLLGSRYYSDHPIFPVKKTIADLNTDMIGRIDAKHIKEGKKDYVYVIGSSLISSELDSMLHVANSESGDVELSERFNDLNDPNHFYRRSDHWNFGRLGIPFIFFFTGVHEDYHRPSDEIQKIMFDKMTRIARTIYATSVLVANTNTPPKVDNQAFINATKVKVR